VAAAVVMVGIPTGIMETGEAPNLQKKIIKIKKAAIK
jgi:hypothetical protein